MHIHILGIGGTFMSALALLAREAGFKVTGQDANCYPPVSELLRALDIPWQEGYEDSTEALKADWVIVGNVIKRGMPVMEAVMNGAKNYSSGPEWLAKHILSSRRVMAVSGTHGKTTTTSMLAYVLSEANLDPSFLIGGVAPNFNTSARLGRGEWFVIEADEYDSAFFDKRPKLMHYRPEVAVLTNLEFDHADIYEDLKAIQKQFHYYLKTIPSQGVVIKPRDDKALNEVLDKGSFSRIEDMALNGSAVWRAEIVDPSGSAFKVTHHNKVVAELSWPLIGQFNVENALSAIACAAHAGVDPQRAATILEGFKPVKRRLEKIAEQDGISVYDDFAHHPTAIGKTIAALKQSQRHKRILVVLEFASYTMRHGIGALGLGQALKPVDKAFFLDAEHFDLKKIAEGWTFPHAIFANTQAIVDKLSQEAKEGDAILIMSNRGFDGIHRKIAESLSQNTN